MKGNRFLLLKADLQEELKNLERLKDELSQILNNLTDKPTFVELRAMGSILHDFYCGVEKVFKSIAVNVDGEIPKGDDWHTKLLNRMMIPIPGVRPRVIGERPKEGLKELLTFRHLFRNIYGFELEWKKLKNLTKSLESVYKEIISEMEKFYKLIDSLAKE